MTRRKLRYGLVGCGRACERIHVPALLATRRVDIVSAFDPIPENTRWLSKAVPEVHLAADVAELLRTAHLDAISVCTPNDRHVSAVVEAATAGIAVLCEKPVATSSAEMQVAADAIHAAGSPFAVNLCHRYHPLLRGLLDELRTAVTIDVQLEICTPGLRAWRPRSEWYGNVDRAGGGALLDLGTHGLDVMWQVIGDLDVAACEVDQDGVEDRAEVRLGSPRGTGVLRLDRRASRFANVLECALPDGRAMRLDFLAGELSADGELMSTAGESEWMQAGVERFVRLLDGEDVEHAGCDDATVLQEVISRAYAIRRIV